MKESMNKEQERKRIGGKIAAWRKARGMTQQQLADMAGLAGMHGQGIQHRLPFSDA